MINKASVFYGNDLAGTIERIDTGYQFSYDTKWKGNRRRV